MFKESRPQGLSLGHLALYALLVATCVGVWTGPAQILPRAQAQIPDAGLQRNLILEEVRRTNELLQDLKQILHTQPLNVRIVGADNQTDRAPSER